VHVVYNSAEQNISDLQVQSQIDVLNADFSALNSDYNNYDAGYTTAKGDANIQFCLVGVRHVRTSKKSFGANDQVKRTKQGGDDAIDPMHVMNIWVCNLGQNLLGYAQFPGGAVNTFSVVCHYKAFGAGEYNLFPAYNKGRTTTHEIGHCLGLRHIWGDATCGNDFVGDTPLHNAANFGCPGEGHLSTCSGNPLEMWMNYMDYTDDACMYFFSNGQVDRMNFYIDNDPQLNSIVNSGLCGSHPVTSAAVQFEKASNEFVAYPTITSGLVTVRFHSSVEGVAAIYVYDLRGAMVTGKQFSMLPAFTNQTIDLSKLPNGMYLLQAVQGNRKCLQKIIVQH